VRIFFKILLFPISLALTIFIAVFTFLVERVAGLLNIFSGILFIGAVITFIQYFFGWPYGEAGATYALVTAISVTAFAFILSPYGLPTVMIWILAKLAMLNNAIKAI
jgi:hypothetical protein